MSQRVDTQMLNKLLNSVLYRTANSCKLEIRMVAFDFAQMTIFQFQHTVPTVLTERKLMLDFREMNIVRVVTPRFTVRLTEIHDETRIARLGYIENKP